MPVHAGCARPLVRELVTAEYVHGKTGLDGAALPEPGTPLADGHAVDVIVDDPARAPAGHGHALPDRAADQHRHGDAQGARRSCRTSGRSC